MQRIVVLNPKGGSGKTTIAVNLASYFALRQQMPVLMDYDPQGSSLRWVKKRQPTQPWVYAVAAFEKEGRTTRSFQLRTPDGATHIIVDTPAALDAREMPDLTRSADKILVPVLPSDIDIHACSRCIRDLLLVAKVRREDNRLGVIANRVRRNTLTYQSLIRFLDTLGVPIVATIRDSQNYVRSAELGLGVHEMKSYIAREDVEQWAPLIAWLALPEHGRTAVAVAAGSPAGVSGTAHASSSAGAESANGAANPVGAATAAAGVDPDAAADSAALGAPEAQPGSVGG